MHRIIGNIFFLVIILTSCTPSEEIPADILPRDSMISVLADLQLVEARIQALSMERNDSTRQVAYGYYKYVFQKHHISSAYFKKSFDYYSKHLGTLTKMYDEVITKISSMEAESKRKP